MKSDLRQRFRGTPIGMHGIHNCMAYANHVLVSFASIRPTALGLNYDLDCGANGI